MPFGLKNVGATYQKTTIFYDIMHEVVECYVDDLVVKTRRRTDPLADLKQVFAEGSPTKDEPSKMRIRCIIW